jgi:hypothetical protein
MTGLPARDQLAAAPLSIVVLGPGFGESIVLPTVAPDGEAVWGVIDSARRERRSRSLNPALKLLVDSDARPSLVLLTHPHQDHTSGFASVVERAAPGATVACVEPLLIAPSPYAPSEDPDDDAAVRRSQTKLAHRAILRAWAAGAAKWPLTHDDTFDLAGWWITVLHPDDGCVADAVARFEQGQDVNLNDLSASILIEREAVALVLGADCEQAAWTAIEGRRGAGQLRHTRPVKVSHHGSTTGIHPVLIDDAERDDGRIQVVTPFPKSGTLPRFGAGEGVERLLRAAGAIELTAMPVDLVAAGDTVAFGAAQAAMVVETFEDDAALEIRLDEPPGAEELLAATRDPLETWVLLGVHDDGVVDVSRGDHAVVIVE